MKKIIYLNFFVAFITFVIIFGVSCGKNELISQDQSQSDILSQRGGPNSNECYLNNPSSTVSETEIAMLKQMREEEKLAGDVYKYFYNKYKVAVFKNIYASETRHADRVKCLLDHYGIPDPTLNGSGVFSDSNIQALYNELIDQGKQSLMEAYKVGCIIEDLDIKDLDEGIDKTQNTAIIQIFENIMCGSYNHMRSFYPRLTSLGGSYNPQYITYQLFNEIVNTPKQSCGNPEGGIEKGQKCFSKQSNQNCSNDDGNSGTNGNNNNGNGNYGFGKNGNRK